MNVSSGAAGVRAWLDGLDQAWAARVVRRLCVHPLLDALGPAMTRPLLAAAALAALGFTGLLAAAPHAVRAAAVTLADDLAAWFAGQAAAAWEER